MSNDINKLSHTSWNCRYHIVFAPKYRRQVFYKAKRVEIGKILRQLCEWKGVEIIEAEVCPDHIHMLLAIPPKYSVGGVMGYVKGKSSLMIYERWKGMEYRYRNFYAFHAWAGRRGQGPHMKKTGYAGGYLFYSFEFVPAE